VDDEPSAAFEEPVGVVEQRVRRVAGVRVVAHDAQRRPVGVGDPSFPEHEPFDRRDARCLCGPRAFGDRSDACSDLRLDEKPRDRQPPIGVEVRAKLRESVPRVDGMVGKDDRERTAVEAEQRHRRAVRGEPAQRLPRQVSARRLDDDRVVGEAGRFP